MAYYINVWLGPKYASDLFSARILLIYLHPWKRTILKFYIHNIVKFY